jgi:hypothetical protein
MSANADEIARIKVRLEELRAEMKRTGFGNELVEEMQILERRWAALYRGEDHALPTEPPLAMPLSAGAANFTAAHQASKRDGPLATSLCSAR